MWKLFGKSWGKTSSWTLSRFDWRIPFWRFFGTRNLIGKCRTWNFRSLLAHFQSLQANRKRQLDTLGIAELCFSKVHFSQWPLAEWPEIIRVWTTDRFPCRTWVERQRGERLGEIAAPGRWPPPRSRSKTSPQPRRTAEEKRVNYYLTSLSKTDWDLTDPSDEKRGAHLSQSGRHHQQTRHETYEQPVWQLIGSKELRCWLRDLKERGIPQPWIFRRGRCWTGTVRRLRCWWR